MAIIKCKMCGGDLELMAGSTVAECEYCGTRQTVPNADNEKKLTLFARANRLRMVCDFDKAAGIYESIVSDFPEEAEAYWGLVLCKYGIEYVDDPATGKKIPTCHRSSFENVMDDSDLELAQENADGIARKLYREEAKQIEQLRREIVAVSNNEAPYDIFICYKETDAAGDRTLDSVLAQDLYTALTDKGYRVFFSRISLEDKLGQEYEPYIFAALNSAKIMLVVGTDYDHFNAVWVKNEWSRFLKLMAKNKEKHLIPCFKGIDAYDIPKEFAKLQAQDLGKVGATQDLLRGIEKLLPRQKEPAGETIVVQQASAAASVAPLLKRALMFVEDSQWKNADEYCEKILDADPENAHAYLVKLLSGNRVTSLEALAEKRLQQTAGATSQTLQAATDPALLEQVVEKYTVPGYYSAAEIQKIYSGFDCSYTSCVDSREKQRQMEDQWWKENYFIAKISRFADAPLAAQLQGTAASIFSQMDARISQAEAQAEDARQDVLKRYAALEQTVAQVAQKHCKNREADYETYANLSENTSIESLRRAISVLEKMGQYKNAPELVEKYNAYIRQTLLKAAEARQAMERQMKELSRKARKRAGRITLIVVSAIAVCVALILLWTSVLHLMIRYNKAQNLVESGEFDQAIVIFTELDDYKDSADKVLETNYAKAESLLASQDFDRAVTIFTELGDYSDASARILEAKYAKAEFLLESLDYDGAVAVFAELGDYSDAPTRILETKYAKAESLLASQDYAGAIEVFRGLGNYKNAAVRLKDTKYHMAGLAMAAGDYEQAVSLYASLGDHADSASLLPEALYLHACVLVDDKQYFTAQDRLLQLGNYADYVEKADALYVRIMDAYYAAGQYGDALFVYSMTQNYSDRSDQYKDMAYKHAQSLFEKKDYSKAKTYFLKVPGYLDANQQISECDYQKGLLLMAKKDYTQAVEAFKNVKNYKDSKTQIKEAKYLYVLSHKNSKNTTTHEYLKELKAAKYKDSAALFKELYAWKVTIVANQYETNSTQDRTSLSRYDTWYFHISLSGGEPNAEVQLKYVGYFPDGSAYSGKWDSKWGDGWTGSCYFWYNNPGYGQKGTFKLKIYDSKGNLLAEKSIKIT